MTANWFKNELQYKKEINQQLSTIWKYYCWLVQRTAWVTWNQSITWVWFTPKYIDYIVYWRYWPLTAKSEWKANSSTNTIYTQCDYTWWTINWVNWTWANPAMAHIRTAVWQYIEPHLVSFDNDWFTIDWQYISQNADIIFTAFW